MKSGQIDVFLCYRHAYAQTAKQYKEFLKNHNLYSKACNKVWYSNHEAKGNYLLDVSNLIQASEMVVIFLANGFTDGFWDRWRRRPNYNQRNPHINDCVTVKEIIEIEKRRQADPNFQIVTVNIDGYQLSVQDCKVLKKVFQYEGIYQEDSLYHFTKCNVNPFYPAVDNEFVFFTKLSESVFDNGFFKDHSLLGNFYFNSKKQTYVDIALWEVDKEIQTKDIDFILFDDMEKLSLYENVRNAKCGFSHTGQNDQMISYVHSTISNYSDTENRKLTVYYTLIDYYLNRKCKYLQKLNYDVLSGTIAQYDIDTDLFCIPNAMGLSISVITKDNYFVFSRRRYR